jgi:hypothetical protein
MNASIAFRLRCCETIVLAPAGMTVHTVLSRPARKPVQTTTTRCPAPAGIRIPLRKAA